MMHRRIMSSVGLLTAGGLLLLPLPPASAATFAVVADLEIQGVDDTLGVAGVDLALIPSSVSGAVARSDAAEASGVKGTTGEDGQAHLAFTCDTNDGDYMVMVRNVSASGVEVDPAWVAVGTSWTAVATIEDCAGLKSAPAGLDATIPVSLVVPPTVSTGTGPGGGAVEASLPPGTTVSAFEVAAPAVADTGRTYPLGVVDFTLSSPVGGTVTVDLRFATSLAPSKVTARKLTNGVWGAVPGAEITATTLDEQPALQLSYAVTDGGPMDEDGVANGVIEDPVGLSVAKAPVTFPASAKVKKPAGTAKVGKKLKVVLSGWPSGTRFTYQWLANGKKIKKATRSSFKLTKAQRGKRVSVAVTATRTGYVKVVRTSPRSAKVKK